MILKLKGLSTRLEVARFAKADANLLGNCLIECGAVTHSRHKSATPDSFHDVQGQGGRAAEGEPAAGEQHPRDGGHEPQDEGEPGRAAQVSSDWWTAGHVTTSAP